jgi:hypothetical protein
MARTAPQRAARTLLPSWRDAVLDDRGLHQGSNARLDLVGLKGAVTNDCCKRAFMES